MIPYPNIDPNIVSIGPIHIRWYGAMYVLGFVAAYILIQKQKASRQIGLVGQAAQDLIFYLAVGVIVGGRLGYIIFYQYHDYLFYLKQPLEIISTWRGGHNGYLWGNNKPALGIEIDEAKAAKYPISIPPIEWTQSRLPDGTIWTP